MATTFDESELMERVDNDVAFLSETVDMLIGDGPVLIEQIRQAIAAGDGAGVGRHAHALKGMISNFCAPQAHACSAEVEGLGKRGDLGTAPAALDRLSEHLAALTGELAKFVKERS